jgi:uncharacterized damage-inducible protein DinB
MNLKEYLVELYDYNCWANKRYLAVAETLTEEQLFRKQGHSWDSVHGVLLHMMSSETVWLKRWHGESPKAHLDPKDFPTLASVRENWTNVEKQMREFLSAQTEQSLQQETAYVNFQGEAFHLPLWQFMAHVPNHNTHHRGELAAMFALMNMPHPEEEVVQYFLFESGQRKE